ncbi:MAG: CDP-glycerol glycerophosphotransferase family protein [Ferruginibacter sp.]
MIRKKRVLIPITILFSVRYILRSKVIESLQQFVEPVLLLNWQEEELEKELNAKGVEFHYFPEAEFGRYFDYITKVNGYKYGRRIKSISTAIDKRRNRLLLADNKQFARKKAINLLLNTISYLVPQRGLRVLENRYIKKATNLSANLDKLRQLNIDTVLTLTPFLKNEFLVLKSFAQLNVPIIYSVLSFDNLTTRGYLPVQFDHFFVWNTLNKNEVLRIFGKDKKVDIVGPVQFDFYWDKNYCWDKTKWMKELKINTERPIILFGAGHYSIVPNEPDWLVDIDIAITNGEIVNNPLILFRKHPLDPWDRWNEILDQCKNVHVDNSGKAADDHLATKNITKYDIEKLCSTLQWTDVHVNASSTLTLDGAIFSKPQIGPAYSVIDRQLSTVLKDLYYREHYLPITQSGGVQIAYSKKELINYLNEALLDPGKYSKERKAMVDIYCEGEYGKSAVRLVNSLREAINA